jgi:hypothetical protein
MRLVCYPSSNRDSDSSRIVSYFFEAALTEWLAFVRKGQQHEILDQFVLREGVVTLHTQKPPEEAPATTAVAIRCLSDHRHREFADPRLPSDFNPRVIVDDGQAFAVARNRGDLRAVVAALCEPSVVPVDPVRNLIDDSGRLWQRYRWSKMNWTRYCGKIALEFLCLYKGATYCLNSDFDGVRAFASSDIDRTGRELVFDEHGPQASSDVPAPVFVDLTTTQDAPTIQAPLPPQEAGSHTIVVFEDEGWVSCAISLCGLPPSVLILGKPTERLGDLFFAAYNDDSDGFRHLRLACDRGKPVIPLPVRGDLTKFVRQYGLRSA